MAKAHWRTSRAPVVASGWLVALLVALGCQQAADASSKVEVTKSSLVEGKAPTKEEVPAEKAAGDTASATKGEAPASATAPAAAPVETARPTASADAPAGAQRSLVVEQAAFRIWLQAPQQTLKPGEKTTLQAILEAKGEYHCNEEYPHKFKLDPAPPNLAYPAKVAKGMKVTEKRGVLDIEVEGKSPGEAKISGSLMFSVCTDERCLVEKQPLALALRVE